MLVALKCGILIFLFVALTVANEWQRHLCKQQLQFWKHNGFYVFKILHLLCLMLCCQQLDSFGSLLTIAEQQTLVWHQSYKHCALQGACCKVLQECQCSHPWPLNLLAKKVEKGEHCRSREALCLFTLALGRSIHFSQESTHAELTQLDSRSVGRTASSRQSEPHVVSFAKSTDQGRALLEHCLINFFGS